MHNSTKVDELWECQTLCAMKTQRKLLVPRRKKRQPVTMAYPRHRAEWWELLWAKLWGQKRWIKHNCKTLKTKNEHVNGFLLLMSHPFLREHLEHDGHASFYDLPVSARRRLHQYRRISLAYYICLLHRMNDLQKRRRPSAKSREHRGGRGAAVGGVVMINECHSIFDHWPMYASGRKATECNGIQCNATELNGTQRYVCKVSPSQAMFSHAWYELRPNIILVCSHRPCAAALLTLVVVRHIWDI